MFRIFIITFCLCGALEVWAGDFEEKIMSIENGNVICGPATCLLSECAMCFYTGTLSTDSKNVKFITACGTCLGFNGNVVREKCLTESTTLMNYTNRISINLLNSTVDSSKIKNSVVNLMLTEMSQGLPSAYNPYPPRLTTPPSMEKQNVYVFQPPAQYITVNAGTTQGRSYLPRFGTNIQNDPCDPPRPDCMPIRRISSIRPNQLPNQLPPQADQIFRIMANIISEAEQVNAALSDALAGNSIGFLSDSKSPFPVWTPTNGKK